MRQLKIDISDLEMAFEGWGDMITYYLDLETGEVLRITDDDQRLLEQIYADYYDEETRSID